MWRGDGGDIDVDPFGKDRVMLYNRAKRFKVARGAILHEKDGVRIADIDGDGGGQILPRQRHGARIHRVSERDGIPIKAGRGEVYADQCAIDRGAEQTACCFYLDIMADQAGDAAGGVATAFHL